MGRGLVQANISWPRLHLRNYGAGIFIFECLIKLEPGYNESTLLEVAAFDANGALLATVEENAEPFFGGYFNESTWHRYTTGIVTLSPAHTLLVRVGDPSSNGCGAAIPVPSQRIKSSLTQL